jgi:hypothetical protein
MPGINNPFTPPDCLHRQAAGDRWLFHTLRGIKGEAYLFELPIHQPGLGGQCLQTSLLRFGHENIILTYTKVIAAIF